MPPAAAMDTLLLALTASFQSAAAEFSLAIVVPLRASLTRRPMPPAAAIATSLSSLTARFESAPAAYAARKLDERTDLLGDTGAAARKLDERTDAARSSYRDLVVCIGR
uniref:Uncharacterized protein n=1 Tax=Chrysotila carterae TaxID=13221 RepID=A0A6T0AD89_CHRCT